MTTTIEPSRSEVSAPAPAKAAAIPGQSAAIPTPAPAVPDAAPPTSRTPENRSGSAVRVLVTVAILGGAIVAGIGFALSYSALKSLAEAKGFGWGAYVFPIGIDAGIVVCYALDLYLIRRQTPWPVLRLLAHLLTLGTIYFNAHSGDEPIRQDPTAALMHGITPLLFIASVEAARRLVMKAADLAADATSMDRVPLHRWVLAPWRTWLLYRRMRLWEIPSYSQVVGLERERLVYRVMLEREYGDDWRRAAPADERLPLTMAPYGLSVDEALALPQEYERRQQERGVAADVRRMELEAQAAQRAADAEIRRMKTEAAIVTTRYEVQAATGSAEARSHAAQAAAEAAAAAETAAARRAAQAADRIAEEEHAAEETAAAAEARRRAAETDLRTAETLAATVEAEARALEGERVAAEEAARKEAAELAALQAREDAAETAFRAAETERRAAEMRRQAAEIEVRALEAEDLAQLNPTERAARKVARMALADADGIADAVDLQTIADALGVSTSTASVRRREAAELLAQGYRP